MSGNLSSSITGNTLIENLVQVQLTKIPLTTFLSRNHKEPVSVDVSSVLCISPMLSDCDRCRVLCQVHTHVTQHQNPQLLITHLL